MVDVKTNFKDPAMNRGEPGDGPGAAKATKRVAKSPAKGAAKKAPAKRAPAAKTAKRAPAKKAAPRRGSLRGKGVRKAAPAKRAAAVAKSNGHVTIHYSVNGKPMGSPPGKGQNTLGGMAYFHTRGIDPNRDRITTEELIALLTAKGVIDVRAGGWKVELPNGKVIEAVVVSEVPLRGPRTW